MFQNNMQVTDPILVIRELTKSFPGQENPAIDSLTMTCPPGKIVGIVGPDGAGKTTLIRMIVGLLKPTSGEIRVFGFDPINEGDKVHSVLSYMPQKFGLYEDLTVKQNLELYATLQGLSKNQMRQAFYDLLHFSNLKPFIDRLAGNLSGGMKQKLGLACSLIRKPNVLVLDEPTVGIDPISRRELWHMIEKLLHEGISIVWSTSYLDEAEKCHEVLLLNEGKRLYGGPPEELTSRLQGQTYWIQNITENKRHVLSKALLDSDIIDSIIQSEKIRLIMKTKNIKPDLQKLEAGNEALLIETRPRFEDAFLAILGGGPKGPSPISSRVHEFENTHDNLIEAKNLTKKFGDFKATDNVSFKVKRGEIFGLLGPNGAGKSTTFRMLCGLIAPTTGQAFVKGISIDEAPAKARSQIGYMAQKFSLYGNMTVRQNLEFFSGIYPVEWSKRDRIIDELVDIFSLEHYLNTPSSELPLGFKQRLALSCALIHRPEVLFLDEATSGVDPVTRREFWNHINSLVEKGVTVLITTHFMEEAEYCDRIALMNKGKIMMIDTPDVLKEKVRTKENPSPTMEDAFIQLSQENNV